MSDNTSKSLLNSYALVKASWLQNDYISSFIPLAATLLNKKAYGSFDIKTFCEDFEIEYGFPMPQHPVTTLLSMMQKQKYIQFNKPRRNWTPVFKNMKVLDITKKRDVLAKKYEKILEAIVEFAKNKYDTLISKTDAESILSSFIHSNSSEILSKKNYRYENNFKERTIIENYISSTFEGDNNEFEIIKQIAVGHLLVDALTLTTSNNGKSDFKDVCIYIDTRVILNLIGCYGEYRRKTYVDLIEKLYEQGAALHVFRHTLNEVRFSLEGCERWIDSLAFDPEIASSTLRYLKFSGKDQKYVQGLIVGYEKKLEKYHVELEEHHVKNDSTVDSKIYEHQIDRKLLKAKIWERYEAIGIEIHGQIEKTIEYDIDNIETIYHKRRGEQFKDINKTKTFLMTTNRSLVYASKNFHQETYEQNTIQACIQDTYIGTFLWARAGINYCDNAMKARLISDCSIAMEPPQHAISMYCKVVDELKESDNLTEEECVALRSYGLSTHTAQTKLMTSEDFEYRDIHEIMEEIRQNTIKDKTKEFKEKEETYITEINQKTDELDKVNEENTKNKEKILLYENAEREKNDKIFSECSKKAKNYLKFIPISLNAGFNIIVQVVLCFIPHQPVLVNILRIGIPVVSVIVGVIFQKDCFNCMEKWENKLRDKCLKKKGYKSNETTI